MIIGLEEDSRVYDSNVLVVVKTVDDEVRRLIAKSALEVNDKHECTISYYIATPSDEGLINEFKKIRETIKWSKERYRGWEPEQSGFSSLFFGQEGIRRLG